MAAKKKRRPANDRSLKLYKGENRWLKNKARKIEKHLEKYPNDLQSLKVMKAIDEGKGPVYSRNKGPKGHTWSPGEMWFAQVKGSIKGKVQHHLDFGANIDKTPSRPDWVKLLESLRSTPKIRVKRRGYRRVKN